MKPAANISVDVPETPIQPKKTGAFLSKIKNTAQAATMALGLMVSAKADGIAMNPNTLNTGSSNIPSQHVEGVTTITFSMPAGSQNG